MFGSSMNHYAPEDAVSTNRIQWVFKTENTKLMDKKGVELG